MDERIRDKKDQNLTWLITKNIMGRKINVGNLSTQNCILNYLKEPLVKNKNSILKTTNYH